VSTILERRQFLRSVFHAPVRLGLAGHDSQAYLHDISLKGALVEVSASWGGRVGDTCLLRLALAPDSVIRMEMLISTPN